MTASITQTAPCQRAMSISVSPEAIQPTRQDVLKEFQREASVPGFRKGKAPADLVDRKFAGQIREELIRRLTRQAFEQTAEQHKLRPVGPFEVTKLEFDEAKGLALEAQVEVEPDFKLGEYRGITLRKVAQTVTAEERQQALQQIQESMAELVPAAEGQESQEKQKRVPALDDELAKDAGFESLAKLEEHVEAKLREQKQAQQTRELEKSLFDELLHRHPFEVPAGLVQRQTERLTQDFQLRLLMSGMAEAQVAPELEKYTEQLRNNAVRHVKLGFILDRIAEQEQVSVTQDELVDRLWKLSRRWGKEPAEVRRLLDSQGLWPSVLSSIRQDKAVRLLLDAAHVDES
jgi:FKBP-type peptidyl-prolyl cis-trans isomerase (trigger factor)